MPALALPTPSAGAQGGNLCVPFGPRERTVRAIVAFPLVVPPHSRKPAVSREGVACGSAVKIVRRDHDPLSRGSCSDCNRGNYRGGDGAPTHQVNASGADGAPTPARSAAAAVRLKLCALHWLRLRGSCLISHYQTPVKIGSCWVRPGDMVVGDIDGAIVVPPKPCFCAPKRSCAMRGKSLPGWRMAKAFNRSRRRAVTTPQ